MKNTLKQARLESAIGEYLIDKVYSTPVSVDIDSYKLYEDTDIRKVYEISIAGNTKKNSKKLGKVFTEYLIESHGLVYTNEYIKDDEIYFIQVDKECIDKLFPKTSISIKYCIFE